jgi:hypothetical protein
MCGMSALLPAAVLVVSLAHANLQQQERTVPAFTKVSVGGGFELKVHRGGAQKVIIRADKDIIEEVETKVVDGQLRIGLNGHWHMHTGHMEVEVTAPDLIGVEGSGGTKVSGDGPKGKACTIEGSGGTEIDLKGVACEGLKLEVSGGANVKLSGAAKKLDMDASGGVDLDTGSLQVADAKLEASGGVSGTMAVSETIDSDFSGGVTLKIKGHPRVKKMSASGGASTEFED